MRLGVALAVSIGIAGTAQAQAQAGQETLLQAPTAHRLTVPDWFPRHERATPLGDLIPRPTDPKTSKQQTSPFTSDAAPRTKATTVVCGLRMVPADPAFDAAMRRQPPATGPTPTIRTVVPSVCQ
jgi:hypothetical protein